MIRDATAEHRSENVAATHSAKMLIRNDLFERLSATERTAEEAIRFETLLVPRQKKRVAGMLPLTGTTVCTSCMPSHSVCDD